MILNVRGLDKNNKYVLDIISKSVDNYYDKLNVFICDEDEVKIFEREASLSINDNNIYFLSKDKIIIEAFLRIQAKKISLKRIYNIEDSVLNIAASRELLKNGFSDMLTTFYFWNLAVKNKQILTVKEFVEVNIPWIVFINDDQTKEMLKNMAKKFIFHGELNDKCRKFFSLAKTNNYELIDNEYKLIINADNKI